MGNNGKSPSFVRAADLLRALSSAVGSTTSTKTMCITTSTDKDGSREGSFTRGGASPSPLGRRGRRLHEALVSGVASAFSALGAGAPLVPGSRDNSTSAERAGTGTPLAVRLMIRPPTA